MTKESSFGKDREANNRIVITALVMSHTVMQRFRLTKRILIDSVIRPMDGWTDAKWAIYLGIRTHSTPYPRQIFFFAMFSLLLMSTRHKRKAHHLLDIDLEQHCIISDQREALHSPYTHSTLSDQSSIASPGLHPSSSSTIMSRKKSKSSRAEAIFDEICDSEDPSIATMEGKLQRN